MRSRMSSCIKGSLDDVYDGDGGGNGDGNGDGNSEGTEIVRGDEEDMIISLPSPEIEAGLDQKNGDAITPCILGSQSCHSAYGKPESPKVIQEVMSSHVDDKGRGLVWNAIIVPDHFDAKFDKTGNLKMLGKKDYDVKNRSIKPRRGKPTVKSSDFFSSLVKISGADEHEDFEFELYKKQPRWIFSGVLNGWPALQTLEVVRIECKRSLTMKWRTHWDSTENPNEQPPTFPDVTGLSEVRAVLRSPPYTAHGWSKSNPGYLFWFEGNGTGEPDRLLVGEKMIHQFERDRIKNGKHGSLAQSPKCIKVHMISHRYATGDKAVVKDRFTYHSLALLEWDHGKFCTVVELAYLGGLGGYGGKCNWLEDKTENPNSLYKQMPKELVHPWIDYLSEIRMINVRAKNVQEFLNFMNSHLGKHERFLDVQHTFSHDVRLSFSSKEHIVRYLMNYISRGKSYSEFRRNCQTFAADFCAFLAGKRDVQPFHPINRLEYRNNTHYFMYEFSMYETKE